jgi:hypothetical protein
MKRAKGPSSYFSVSAKGSAGGGEKGGGGEVEEDGVEVTDSESSATAARAGSGRWIFGRCNCDRERVAEGLRGGKAPQRPPQLLVGTRRAEEAGVVGGSIVLGRCKSIQKKDEPTAGWLLPKQGQFSGQSARSETNTVK